jgi:hypothetical protein
MTGFAYLPAYRAARAPVRVALIGFDASGQRLAGRLISAGMEIAAYDRAFENPRSSISTALRRIPVAQFASAEGAVADADLIVVTVAGDALLDIARRVVRLIEPGAWFCDCTGAADGMVRRAVAALGSVARYARANLSLAGDVSPIDHARELSAVLDRAGVGTARGGAIVIPFRRPHIAPVSNTNDARREMIA